MVVLIEGDIMIMADYKGKPPLLHYVPRQVLVALQLVSDVANGSVSLLLFLISR